MNKKSIHHSSKKWLSCDFDSQVVVHDVRPLLAQVWNKKCNLISIFGRARQGKSFLMNVLSGEQDVFRISNAKDSCTQGIDLSSKFITTRSFAGIDSGDTRFLNHIKDADSTYIGFTDAEGQGDKDVTYDAKLICPILLASRCVLFNWKGDLQKDLILNTLGIMTRAARNVQAESESDSIAPGLKRQFSSTTTTSKKFGHLHVLFRDWQATGDSASVYSALFDMENTSSKDHVPGAETRNLIRQELLSSFQSIKVWLFEAPTELVRDLRTALTLDKCSKAFRSQIQQFRVALSLQLSESETKMTGRSLQGLVQACAASLSKGEVALPLSAYQALQEATISRALKLFEKDVHHIIESILDEFKSLPRRQSVTTAVRHFDELVAKKESAAFANLVNAIGGEINSIDDSKASMEDTEDTGLLPMFAEIVSNSRSTFVAKYSASFAPWIFSAKNNALNHLKRSLADEKLASTDDKTSLESQLQNLLKEALSSFMIEGKLSEEEDSAISDSINAVKEGWAELASNARERHSAIERAKQMKREQEISTLLTNILEDLSIGIKKEISTLTSANDSGFPLSALEARLNDKFFAHRDSLVKKGLLTAVDELARRCSSLRSDMVKSYREVQQERLLSTLQRAQKEAEKKMLALAADWDGLLESQILSYDKDITPELDRAMEEQISETLQSVQGWLLPDNVGRSVINNALNNTEFAKVLREVLQNEWEPFKTNCRDILSTMKAAEEEEEDDNDGKQIPLSKSKVESSNIVKSDNRPASKKGSLSAAEQRERARAWAEQQFGQSKASKASSKASRKSLATAFPKSVQQQREDALKFALKTFANMDHNENEDHADGRLDAVFSKHKSKVEISANVRASKPSSQAPEAALFSPSKAPRPRETKAAKDTSVIEEARRQAKIEQEERLREALSRNADNNAKKAKKK